VKVIVLGNFNNLYIPVRERIFTLFKSKKISQREFAQAIDVMPQTITDWKSGKSFSFLKKLPAIAEALDTTEVWLLTGKHTSQNPETVNLLEEIAGSADIHLLDLIGVGHPLDQYRTDTEFPEDMPPEQREAARQETAGRVRNAFDKVSLADKGVALGVLERRTLLRNIRRYSALKGLEPAEACKASGAGEGFLDEITEIPGPSVAGLQMLAQYLGVITSELLGEIPTSSKLEGNPHSALTEQLSRDDREIFVAENIKTDEQQLLKDYQSLNPQGQEYIRQTMCMAVQIYKKKPDLSELESQA